MGRQNKHRGHLKLALKEALAERDGMWCGICGVACLSLQHMTIDHIIPHSLGGGNGYHNLQIAHEKCNLRKGNGKLSMSNLEKLKQQSRDKVDNTKEEFLHED